MKEKKLHTKKTDKANIKKTYSYLIMPSNRNDHE